MRKTAAAITILLMLFTSIAAGAQFINVTKANPISIPIVPSIRVGCSSPSYGEGFVNSSVQFRVYVYLPVDSPELNSVSYSLDGAKPVNLGNLSVSKTNDFGPEKIAFKTYTAVITLDQLSEGTHALVAYANNMSESINFSVNSNYHVTALNVVSPKNLIYSNSVPLAFTYTGNITNAHYYVYSGRQLVSDAALSGNTTIDGLADGSYDLFVFVTTQFGQDSQQIHFTVGYFSEYLFIGLGVTALVAFSLGLLIYFKKLGKR